MTILRKRSAQAERTITQLKDIWNLDSDHFKDPIVKQYSAFQRAGIPMKYIDLWWEDFQNSDKDALKKAQDFSANLNYHWKSGGGILIFGPNGAGKSFLSYMIAKQAIFNNISTFCFSLVEYQRKKWLRQRPELLLELLQMIENSKLIILDDYGKEYGKGNDWSSFENYMVVSEIFEGTKAVVVNTALPLRNLKEKAGSSILSRIGHFTSVPMSGKDFRSEEIKGEEFKKIRSAHQVHDCWKAHPLLSNPIAGKCFSCLYRFHPYLCVLRYKKMKEV